MPNAMALANIRQTTTFRLTVALGAMFTVATAALIGTIAALTETELTARTDQVLFNEMHRLSGLPASRLPAQIDALIANSASGLNYYAVVGPDGRAIAGNFTLSVVPRDNQAFDVDAGAVHAGRTMAVPLRALVARLPDGGRIEVARDITQIIDVRHRIFVITAYSGVAVILIALLAGAGLSRGPLRRVAQVRTVATRIAAGELGLRIPVASRGDEFDLIASMINAMLNEIERLMEQVKGATDAIAHDLRTPLAHLRQRLQAITAPQDSTPELAGVPAVADAIADLDQILRRFNALLRISELEASGRHAGFSAVDPMALLADIAELYEPLAEERGICLSLHGVYGQTIFGDETLLLEVVSNLIENALKFVGNGGRVALSVTGDRDMPIIEVRDDGPGIPEAERTTVLGRFQRGAAAGKVAGTGLGLSLVAAIVHLHRFTMVLEDANPGLAVVISCPRHADTQ